MNYGKRIDNVARAVERKAISAYMDGDKHAETNTVIGMPGPQGSKRYIGKGIMIESSALVKPWREAVVWAARDQCGGVEKMIRGPIAVEVTFFLPKPKSAPRSRRYPDKAPDLDKLLRSTFDGLTSAGVWEDDSRVISCYAKKVFCGPVLNVPGCIIFLVPVS